jgi:hypothetical protein
MKQQSTTKSFCHSAPQIKFTGVGGWSHLRRVIKKWRKPQTLSA